MRLRPGLDKRILWCIQSPWNVSGGCKSRSPLLRKANSTSRIPYPLFEEPLRGEERKGKRRKRKGKEGNERNGREPQYIPGYGLTTLSAFLSTDC